MRKEEYSKNRIRNISNFLIKELRNVDGATKKVTKAEDHNVQMEDSTEIMIGQEPIKRYWSIKVFFGKTGKKPFYYHFDMDEFHNYSQYVYQFKIARESIFDADEDEEFECCEKCGDELNGTACSCGRYL